LIQKKSFYVNSTYVKLLLFTLNDLHYRVTGKKYKNNRASKHGRVMGRTRIHESAKQGKVESL